MDTEKRARWRGRWLANHRLNSLSVMAANIAEVSLASIAIPFVLDKYRPGLALLGLVMAIIFSILSFILSRPST